MLKKTVSKILRHLRQKSIKLLPGDILLASYPRSGNTWLRYLLANLLAPDLAWNVNNIARVVPDMHEMWPADWMPRSPRIIKTHNPYHYKYANAIYIYRDGRDVAVSYYHYLNKIKEYSESFNVFFESYLKGDVPFGNWHNHVDSWMFASHPTNLLTVSYEALVDNTVQEVRRIGHFLNQPWTLKQINLAIEKSSFENIKKDYASLKKETHWNKGFQAGVKGGSGKWKEVLTPQQNEHFWVVSGNIASRLGYQK